MFERTKNFRISLTGDASSRPPSFGILLLIFFVMLGGFFLDCLTPLEITDWSWYLIPLFLSIQFRHKFFPYLLASVATVLILASFYISPAGIEAGLAFRERCLGILVIWLVAVLISERLRVEEKLRANEKNLRLVLEDQTDLICRFTADGTFLFVNEVYCNFFGKSMEKLLGKKWHPQAHCDDLSLIEEKLKQLSPENRLVVIENRVYNAAGEMRWMQFANRAIYDGNGRHVETQSVGRDVTERRQLEEMLRLNQERYQSLAESLPDAIFILDEKSIIHYVNTAAAQWLGRPREQLPGHAQSEFFPPEIAAEQAKSLQEVFKTGQLLRRERQHAYAGRNRWIETRLLPMRDSTGKVVSVMGISRDLTEQRQAEEALKEREEWSQKILETAVEGFFRVNLQGKILDVNEAYCRMSGYTRDELISMHLSQLSVNEPSPKTITDHIERITKTGSDRFETRHRRKDGSIFNVEVVATYLKLHGYHVFSFLRDITERKQLEQQVLETSENERRRIGFDLHDGLGQFLAGIAFKTKALEENLAAKSCEESREAAAIVDLVNSAIHQTRSLARGLAPVDVEANGLVAALENLAAESRTLFPSDFNFKCSITHLVLDAPTGMTLFRIAQEAIHNAVNRGAAEHVGLILEETTEHLCLIIRDDGKGFSIETKLRAGMGLRIMQYRANSVGGSVVIHSQPGKGTEVRCRVPLQRPAM